LLLTLDAAGCSLASRAPGQDTASPASTARATAAVAPGGAATGSPAERARALYDEAHRAMIADQDIDTGVAKLEQATALDPEFGEAWYQLGTARLTQAAIARAVDEQAALGFFRAGVRACRRALELMDSGSMRDWDAFELRQTQQRLREDLDLLGAGIEDADDASALAALGRWSDAQGYVDEPPPGGPREDAEPGDREPEPPAPEGAETEAP
jgi:hypothetical protein